MELHRITSLALVCALLAAFTLGCAARPGSETSVSPQPASDRPITVAELEAKALEAPDYSKANPATSAAASGANAFAFRLTAELLKGKETENMVCSPYSVWLPLAALLNATDQGSRDTLLDALGAAGITAEDVNHAASRMLYDLTNEREREYMDEPHNPLQIANAIFVDNDVTLRQEFAQAYLDYFRGQAMNVDFADQSAVDAVNRWASEHTDGLIDEIIQEFDPDTVAAVANAIYFSDRWGWEFDPENTVEDTFHGPGGDSAANFMTREGDAQSYFEDERLQAVSLGFAGNGCMLILLPKDGDASGLLSSLDSAYFEEIRQGFTPSGGMLRLPKFKIESGVMPLRETLVNLGVPLFDETAAPLTGGLIEEDIPVFLSDAVQKAVIEVDEKGTTAAAVTVMMAEGAAYWEPSGTFEMVCDRPFAFILCGSTCDGGSQILFTGVVNQPE